MGGMWFLLGEGNQCWLIFSAGWMQSASGVKNYYVMLLRELTENESSVLRSILTSLD